MKVLYPSEEKYTLVVFYQIPYISPDGVLYIKQIPIIELKNQTDGKYADSLSKTLCKNCACGWSIKEDFEEKAKRKIKYDYFNMKNVIEDPNTEVMFSPSEVIKQYEEYWG